METFSTELRISFRACSPATRERLAQDLQQAGAVEVWRLKRAGQLRAYRVPDTFILLRSLTHAPVEIGKHIVPKGSPYRG